MRPLWSVSSHHFIICRLWCIIATLLLYGFILCFKLMIQNLYISTLSFHLSPVILSWSGTLQTSEGQAAQLPTAVITPAAFTHFLKMVSERVIIKMDIVSESTEGFRVMRGIGRQRPLVQIILHQCCWRCLALRVTTNLAVKQGQCLSLSIFVLYT